QSGLWVSPHTSRVTTFGAGTALTPTARLAGPVACFFRPAPDGMESPPCSWEIRGTASTASAPRTERRHDESRCPDGPRGPLATGQCCDRGRAADAVDLSPTRPPRLRPRRLAARGGGPAAGRARGDHDDELRGVPRGHVRGLARGTGRRPDQRQAPPDR